MTNDDFDDELQAALHKWELPVVEDERNEDTGRTNAINRRSDWKYEPPEEVEEIAPPTAEEIEEIRQQAYEEGLKQGKEEGIQKGLEEGRQTGQEQGIEAGKKEGYEEGMAAAEQDITTLTDLLKKTLDQLQRPVEQVDKQLQDELVNLAVALASSVIKTEVKTNKDIIFQALSEGLKVLPVQEKQYQIHLHPEDIVLIKEHFSEQEIERHGWLFVESPQMSRGGCDITTQNNAVDVSIERRCRDVLDKFLLEHGYQQAKEEG